MMNLLPEEYKDKLRYEYRLRFFTVISLFIFFALGISVVALLPGALSVGTDYFLVRRTSPAPAVSEEEEKIKEQGVALQAFRETLAVLDPKQDGSPVPLSELIQLISAQKPGKIALKSFSFIAESQLVKKLVLSGVALDRESLVAFSKRLSENKTFSEVNFPISNLSKKENIEFSVTLTIKQEKAPSQKEEGVEK